MSKSLSEVLALFAEGTGELYDRFINVTLMHQGTASVISLRNAVSLISTGSNGNMFRINTPVTGQKPNITVSASMSAQETVHSITITIYNMEANIDFNEFNAVEVELGYMSGQATKFKGEIINIYMAKPNPNGELVITCANAKLVDATSVNNFKVTFPVNTCNFNTFIRTIELAIKQPINVQEVPAAWLAKQFTVNKATYQFSSILSLVTWLNSLFMSLAMNDGKGAVSSAIRSGLKKLTATGDGLPPLFVHVSESGIVIKGSYKNNSLKPAFKALSNISSAYMSGDSVGVVTAPYNPEIEIGDFVYVNPKYFKTRIANIVAFNKGNIYSVWCVNKLNFTFSTYTANTMTLTMVNVQNDIFYEG